MTRTTTHRKRKHAFHAPSAAHETGREKNLNARCAGKTKHKQKTKMNKIDITKKYTTRDGRPVIIHAVNGPAAGEPVVASAANTSGWDALTWPIDGRIDPYRETDSDLIEVCEPLEAKIVIDGKGEILGFASNQNADWYDRQRPSASPHRIAKFREVTP